MDSWEAALWGRGRLKLQDELAGWNGRSMSEAPDLFWQRPFQHARWKIDHGDSARATGVGDNEAESAILYVKYQKVRGFTGM